MYLPRLFLESDRARLKALCDENPFATVVGLPHSAGGDGPERPASGGDPVGLDARAALPMPEISHLPCLVDDDCAAVRLHVARGNPLARLAAAGERLTAVFHGPHCYVTPRWYRDPTRQVPTWNYAVVHASGPARVMDAEALRALVGELSARFEAGAEAPWSASETAAGFVDGRLSGIVGIRIEVDRLEGKYKLSQNRSAEDRARVRAGLGERRAPGDLAVLELMHEA
jgi:transcriptional regulator